MTCRLGRLVAVSTLLTGCAGSQEPPATQHLIDLLAPYREECCLNSAQASVAGVRLKAPQGQVGRPEDAGPSRGVRQFPTADKWRFDTSRRRDSWRMREGDLALP